MTSEIRANTLKNRVGLGTVSFTNTGPVVSGIVTISNSTTEGVTLEDNAGVGNSLKITTPTGFVSIGSGNSTFVHLNTDRGVFYFQKRIFVDEGIIASYDENLILQSPSNTNRIIINKDTGLVSIVNDLDVAGTSTFTGDVDIAEKIVHTGDTDTYLQFTANTINLQAGGTTGLSVLDTSVRVPTKLGINGAAPQTPLDVIANGSGYAMAIRGRSSDNIGEIRFTSNNYGSIYSVLQTGATYLNFQVGSITNALRITSDGNMGLGDNAPPNFTGYRSLSIHGSTGGALVFGDDGTDEWETYGGDGVFKIYDRASTTTRLHLDGAYGRFGINTNSFSDTATALSLRNGRSDADHTILDIICNDNQTCRLTFSEDSNSSKGSIRYYYTGDANYMSFYTNGGASTNERLRITSVGTLTQTSTTAFQIAKGTTAQRPSAVTGMIRYNTTTDKLEYYDGSAWQSIKTTFEASGGNSTYTFGGYKVHIFTGNGNFTVTGAGTVDALIVAGGGGAGQSSRSNYNGAWAGGGGAGGVLWQQNISVNSASTYAIVVGNGGAVQNNGQNSTAFGYTAIGGGRGGGTSSAGSGNVNWNGASGGSGGGGLGDKPGPMQGGSGTSGQGNNGAPGTDPGGNPYYEQGGGGGGAGEAGDTDGYGFGGDGRDMSGEFGTSVGENGYFGGGGAGGQGTHNSGVNSGGLGGGGDSGSGYQNNSVASQAGQANTGGGGGAGGNASGSGQGGQAGGSGVVLVRYPL